MDANEAIKKAKSQLQIYFQEEGISDLGLEEVDFSDVEQEWRITLGFSRPWNGRRGFIDEVTQRRPDRVYKVVHIPESGSPRVLRVTNREVAA
jgi:hypothetical protein